MDKTKRSSEREGEDGCSGKAAGCGRRLPAHCGQGRVPSQGSFGEACPPVQCAMRGLFAPVRRADNRSLSAGRMPHVICRMHRRSRYSGALDEIRKFCYGSCQKYVPMRNVFLIQWLMPTLFVANRNDDDIVKSRHSGASRSPGHSWLFGSNGFRLAPE